MAPASALRSSRITSVLAPNGSSLSGVNAYTNAVRPSFETNVRSPVEPKPATRDPGTVFFAVASILSSWARTPGLSTVLPSGSLTTGTRGSVSPPVPYTFRISWLVSQPSRPGTENFWSRASDAGPAAPMPTSVSTTQARATRRL